MARAQVHHVNMSSSISNSTQERTEGGQRYLSDSAAVTTEADVIATTNLYFLPIPQRLRYRQDKPFPFGLALNFLFAAASTATVSNLYYAQPILSYLSDEFQVTYADISLAPTLTQAGYAVGILLISPLGDLVRRRSLVLLLVACTIALSIGVATSQTLLQFEIINFFCALLTVTPQIMLPLTADMAKPEKRAQSLAITLSGLTLGILVARVLSGTITNYSSWRNVYWMAVGLQSVTWIALYFALPDFPPKTHDVSYFQMLWSMLTYIYKFPTLVQCSLIGFLTSAVFQNYWNTLTFLLSDPPYGYNTFQIGLFGLIGILAVCLAPFTGRFIDKLVSWVGVLMGLCIQISAIAIATGAAKKSVGAVAVVCFCLDIGLQVGQVSLSTRIYGLKPEARARLNSIFIISLFLGQTMGTSVGAKLYTLGGWEASAGFSVGLLALAICLLFARGPHATKWVGWDGGRNLRKVKEKKAEEGESDIAGTEPSDKEDMVMRDLQREHSSELKSFNPDERAPEPKSDQKTGL